METQDQEVEITIGEPVALKILDSCMGTDNRRYYKVQWQDTWEAEEDVVAKFQQIVHDYWRLQEENEERKLLEQVLQQKSDTDGVVSMTTEENGREKLTDENIAVETNFYDASKPLGEFFKKVNSPEHKITGDELEVALDANKSCKPPPLVPEKWKHNERPFACDVCQRSYLTEKRLADHKRKLHQAKSTYQCSFCPKVFTAKRNLQSHLNRHTGIGPYPCPGCSKRFMTEHEIDHHKRSCNGLVEKEYQCDVCQKRFATKPHLSFHMKIHLPDDQKPFKCLHCPRTFAYNHDCVHHMRLHNGEKPFKCTDCDEAFHRKSYLTEHMFVHTGISKYQCTECMTYFKTQQMLQTHVKNIHILKKPPPPEKKLSKNDRRYRCEECGKVFRFLKEFHYHLQVNHKDAFHEKNKKHEEFADFEPTMVYKCKKCEKTFQWTSALKKHAETHTDNDDVKKERKGKKRDGQNLENDEDGYDIEIDTDDAEESKTANNQLEEGVPNNNNSKYADDITKTATDKLIDYVVEQDSLTIETTDRLDDDQLEEGEIKVPAQQNVVYAQEDDKNVVATYHQQEEDALQQVAFTQASIVYSQQQQDGQTNIVYSQQQDDQASIVYAQEEQNGTLVAYTTEEGEVITYSQVPADPDDPAVTYAHVVPTQDQIVTYVQATAFPQDTGLASSQESGIYDAASSTGQPDSQDYIGETAATQNYIIHDASAHETAQSLVDIQSVREIEIKSQPDRSGHYVVVKGEAIQPSENLVEMEDLSSEQIQVAVATNAKEGFAVRIPFDSLQNNAEIPPITDQQPPVEEQPLTFKDMLK